MSETVAEAGKSDPSASVPPLDASATEKRWSRRVAADIVGMFDVLAVIAGAALPALIYSQTGGVSTQWLSIVQAALVTSIIVHVCLRNWGMYDTTKMDDFPTDPAKLLSALGAAGLAVLGIGVPFAPSDVQLYVWYGTWMSASFTTILAVRILARIVLGRLAEVGRFNTRVAVFGAGPIARRVHDYLTKNALGISFVGTYDDRLGSDRVNPDGLVITGKLPDLIEAGRNGEVDQIIIALPQSADQRMAMIAAKLEQLPVSIQMVTHIASDLVGAGPAHKVSALGTVGLLEVKDKPLADWAPFVKRIEDYALGTILLALTLPLFALIALAVRIESRGPILFRQRRHGLNKKVIEVLKFRTMKVLEDDESLEQARDNDPRMTYVGWFLRRTSLDELPQLFNVLRGEMSLVGPRPHALVHDEQWGEMVERYSNRHQVKPGITGLAQVNGFRGEMKSSDQLKARVEHDLAYIRSWSLGLDLEILGRTVLTVVGGSKGAK